MILCKFKKSGSFWTERLLYIIEQQRSRGVTLIELTLFTLNEMYKQPQTHIDTKENYQASQLKKKLLQKHQRYSYHKCLDTHWYLSFPSIIHWLQMNTLLLKMKVRLQNLLSKMLELEQVLL